MKQKLEQSKKNPLIVELSKEKNINPLAIRSSLIKLEPIEKSVLQTLYVYEGAFTTKNIRNKIMNDICHSEATMYNQRYKFAPKLQPYISKNLFFGEIMKLEDKNARKFLNEYLDITMNEKTITVTELNIEIESLMWKYKIGVPAFKTVENILNNLLGMDLINKRRSTGKKIVWYINPKVFYFMHQNLEK